MRIGLFTDCYYPQVNGVVTSVLMLEEELIKLGHEVTIITVNVPGYEDKKNNVIRLKSLPFHKWKEFRVGLPLFLEPYRHIKSLNLDVIHTHTEFSIGIFGIRMAKALNIPIVHTYHTMYEDYTHYIFNLRYGKNVIKKLIIKTSKQYIKSFNGVIAPTDKTRSALLSYGVKNDIYVVPTGININQFYKLEPENPIVQELRTSLGIDPNDKVILSLGRISEEKSIDMIIDALPELINLDSHIKLLIVGDGPYRSKLDKLTHQYNLEDHVIFTGKVDFKLVNHYYSLADVFVSASKTETQGLTIMEAMATGVPVVVYDDLNISGIVIDSVSGKLFKNKNEMIQALEFILSSPISARAYASAGKSIVAKLSKESYAKKAEQVYVHLIEEKQHYYSIKLNA